MRTPFAWLAHRFPLEPRSLRTASLAALIASILIILGGGVVRVTGSGLGCPDWPTCVGGSIAPTAEMGLHSVIEFVNRLLTVGLCVVVGWVIIAARLQRKQVPEVTRWAWMQFWFVVLNAVIGGITVWVDLNPYVVAGHFLAATLLLTAATITWQKTQNLDKSELPASSQKSRALARWLLVLTAVLIVLGTMVTGTGPHAGDSAEVPRMPFSWLWVTIIHGAAALGAMSFAGLLWRCAKLAGEQLLAQKTLLLILVFVGQGALGIIQALTHLPELMVVLHLVGSALVWIGAVRVLLAAEGSRHTTTRSPSMAL